MSIPVAGQKPEPRGIGGWLILPIIGLIITSVYGIFTFIRDLLPVFKEGLWPALTTPGSAAYHPLWAPALIFELVMGVALIALPIVLLMIMKNKSRRLPKLMVAWYVGVLLAQIIDVVLLSQIPAVANQPDGGDFKDLARAAVVCAIWVPYFLISKRVKNTFVE